MVGYIIHRGHLTPLNTFDSLIFPIILAYFYMSNIFNIGLLNLQCSIQTFTEVSDLNPSSTTD